MRLHALVAALAAASSALHLPRPALTKAQRARQPLPLRIDGQWYDAADYAATQHVGGQWLMEYSRGRDVTYLFRAAHSQNEARAAKALEAMPRIEARDAPAAPHHFALADEPEDVAVDSPLRAELKAMVRRRFGSSLEATKATPGQWARIGVFFALTASCWVGWFRGDGAATALLPLASWLLTAHTAHDATHGSLSTDARVNFWLQFTAHPLFFNVFVWIPQHLLSHHQYTNDEDFDVDLHHFAPAKLSPDTDYGGDSELNAGWTFVVKGCLSTLGTTLLQPARTLLESATPNFDENITPVPEVVAKEALALSMAPSVFVLVYPLVAFGLLDGDWSQALAAALWPYVGASIIWTTMTQTSHVQEACHEDLPDDACWTARQIAHSYDYSVHDELENAVVSALTAGLNAQSLHHALPSIAQSRLPALYDEYYAIAAKHGATPRTSRNIATAGRELLEFVFETNRKDPPPAPPGPVAVATSR